MARHASSRRQRSPLFANAKLSSATRHTANQQRRLKVTEDNCELVIRMRARAPMRANREYALSRKKAECNMHWYVQFGRNGFRKYMRYQGPILLLSLQNGHVASCKQWLRYRFRRRLFSSRMRIYTICSWLNGMNSISKRMRYINQI